MAAPIPRLPRRADAAPTFDVVVTAAERVLAADGVDALTTNRVAEVAGVSIGTLYQYFPNKHAIVAALFDRYLAVFDDIFLAAIEGSRSLEEAAARLATAVAERYASQPAIFRELWRLRTAADAHDRIAASHARMIDAATRLLARMGVTDEARARLLAFTLVHAGDGIANGVANARGSIDPAAAGLVFVQMVAAIARSLPAR